MAANPRRGNPSWGPYRGCRFSGEAAGLVNTPMMTPATPTSKHRANTTCKCTTTRTPRTSKNATMASTTSASRSSGRNVSYPATL